MQWDSQLDSISIRLEKLIPFQVSGKQQRWPRKREIALRAVLFKPVFLPYCALENKAARSASEILLEEMYKWNDEPTSEKEKKEW